MQRDKMTRRNVVIALTALTSSLARGSAARAFPYEKGPGYKSANEFKKDCDLGFGSFDTGQHSTSCTSQDGTVKVGDENGKNCTWHPPGAPRQVDHSLTRSRSGRILGAAGGRPARDHAAQAETAPPALMFSHESARPVANATGRAD